MRDLYGDAFEGISGGNELLKKKNNRGGKTAGTTTEALTFFFLKAQGNQHEIRVNLILISDPVLFFT